MSRSNEVLATRRTDAGGHVQFEAGLAAARAAAPAMLIAADAKGDYAFLNLKAPAFDLTDRGVSGRPAPTGLDAFVYTERGVYRSGETVHLTALLRDAQGAARAGVPLTLVVERPDGVEYRRVAGARSGRRRPCADLADHGLGVDRHLARARLHRSEACRRSARPRSWSRTTCPTGSSSIWRRRAARSPRPRRPSSRSTAAFSTARRPRRSISKASLNIAVAKERPGFAGYQFGLADEEVAAERQPLDDLPPTDDKGKASFEVDLDKLPSSTHPLEAQDRRAHGGAGRPRGRAQDHAAGHRERQHDRRQAAVLRPLARRGRQRHLRRRRRRARRHGGRRPRACTTSCCASRRTISSTSATAVGLRADQDDPRVADGTHRRRGRQAGRISRCRCSGAATGSKCRPPSRTARPPR